MLELSFSASVLAKRAYLNKAENKIMSAIIPYVKLCSNIPNGKNKFKMKRALS